MKNTFTLFSTLFFIIQIQGQCSITLDKSVDTLICGDCVSLSATGYIFDNLNENFNSGSPSGWQFSQSAIITNSTCSVSSLDNSDFIWMGDTPDTTRYIKSPMLNLSNEGYICFDMRYTLQGDSTPCEGPDESDEGIYIQYSIDTGSTWIDIEYWDPIGGGRFNINIME